MSVRFDPSSLFICKLLLWLDASVVIVVVGINGDAIVIAIAINAIAINAIDIVVVVDVDGVNGCVLNVGLN